MKKILVIIISAIIVASIIGLSLYYLSDSNDNNIYGDGYRSPYPGKFQDNAPWPTDGGDNYQTNNYPKPGNGNPVNYTLLNHPTMIGAARGVSIADLYDGYDGFELVCTTSTGRDPYISLITPGNNWDLLWRNKVPAGSSQISGSLVMAFSDTEGTPAIADIDNDGELEIIISLRCAGALAVYERNGNLKWMYDINEGRDEKEYGVVESSPIIADLDGDGGLEIIFGDTGHTMTESSSTDGPSSSGCTTWEMLM